MNANLQTLVSKTRPMGVTHPNMLINSPNPKGIAEAVGIPEAELTNILEGMKKVMAVSPGAAAIASWDDSIWGQFLPLVDEVLTKAAPQATLFGSIGGATSAPQPQTSTTPKINIETTVKLAARSIKANDRQAYELFSLSEKSLDNLVEGAKKKFTNGSATREAIEAYVHDEMIGASAYREAFAAVKAEAEKRGWSIPPKRVENQPTTRTDRETHQIGHAEMSAVLQAVQYDNIKVGDAFDALGFMAGSQSVTSPPATTSLGGAIAASGLFGNA